MNEYKYIIGAIYGGKLNLKIILTFVMVPKKFTEYNAKL